MNIPPELHTAIDAAVSSFPAPSLTEASSELTDAYRSRQRTGPSYITTDAHRLAYAAVRMPATFAAVHAALTYSAAVFTDVPIRSCLDLGAGPGTASWAALQVWPAISRVSLIEQDANLISLGRQFADAGPIALRSADWKHADLASFDSFPKHDLVVCSYAAGELSDDAISRLIEDAWNATAALLIIVEPGTVPGFAHIRSIRDQLTGLGAHMVAPCPHRNACPLLDDDWCHFSQRLERTSLHRHIKSGDLGHEDEKYSYVAVTRQQASLPEGRVLRHPQRRKGHTHLRICGSEGVRDQTVTRSQKVDWKRVRRVNWGDEW